MVPQRLGTPALIYSVQDCQISDLSNGTEDPAPPVHTSAPTPLRLPSVPATTGSMLSIPICAYLILCCSSTSHSLSRPPHWHSGP